MSKLLIVLVALSIAYAVQGKIVFQINMFRTDITKVNVNVI